MLKLTENDQHLLAGGGGKAKQLAMRLISAAANAAGATELVDVTFAHIGSGFYSGQVSVDFAEFLLAEGGKVSIRTQTNASLVDFANPSLRPLDSFRPEVEGTRRLMEIYEELGCEPTWSCAPYHDAGGRPAFGQQIIGSESNAVSFFNSVLGARTNKYGDFLDVCGAIIGRVPLAGLHTDEKRVATHEFRVRELPESVRSDAAFHHIVGIIVGQQAGAAIPVISDLDEAEEDELKAIAAAAATSGAVEMFHVVGITPEAPTLQDALDHTPPAVVTTITEAEFHNARRNLTTDSSGPISAVCLGTPHFSVQEFAKLVDQFSGRQLADGIDMIVTTSRAVHNEISLRGYSVTLAEAGVQIALDTCTYYTPLTSGINGLVMTNSAKWAYYAPGILGVPVAFGSQAECVESAVRGFVHREEDW